jgi:hypothetical protein
MEMFATTFACKKASALLLVSLFKLKTARFRFFKNCASWRASPAAGENSTMTLVVFNIWLAGSPVDIAGFTEPIVIVCTPIELENIPLTAAPSVELEGEGSPIGPPPKGSLSPTEALIIPDEPLCMPTLVVVAVDISAMAVMDIWDKLDPTAAPLRPVVEANVGVPVTALDDKDCSTTPGLPVVDVPLRLSDKPLWRGKMPPEGAFVSIYTTTI